MDPTSRFFAKLRKVAVNIETQSAELQRAYDSRNDEDDDDDDEKTQRAMRACYELSSEVKDIKSQVEADLKQQRQRVTEVERFLDACTVMKRKVGEDMETIRKHCEKYGYHEAPQNQQKTLRGTEQQQQDADDENVGRAAEDAEKVGDEEDSHPAAASAAVADLQRTPQFSDFGLSEACLRRRMVETVGGSGVAEFGGGAVARGGAAASSLYSRSPPQFSDFGLSEVDLRKRLQGPDVTAPSPYFPPSVFVSSVMPQTPKCMLRMDDDDEMRTPQAPYFGLSEHTMCLNNDFTMDLQRKDVEQLQAAGSSTVSALHPGTDGSALPVDGMFLSPNPSVPRIRSKGAYGFTSSPPPPEESPFLKKQALSMPLMSPEVPQAYLKRALGLGEKHTGVTSVPADGGQPDWDLPTPANCAKPGQRPWEYDVPEMSLDDAVRTPETPVLESHLSRRSRGVVSGQAEPVEPSAPSLKLDDPMNSPTMPDLSSETLTNIHHMLDRKTAVVLPNHRPPGKENRRTMKVISAVTQAEFQRLPSYLRQMPLSSLNQAVQKLNQAAADSQHDENEEFSMLDLKRMAGLDTPVSKAPVYFLCLTELNRLKQVRGVGMNSEYRLVAR